MAKLLQERQRLDRLHRRGDVRHSQENQNFQLQNLRRIKGIEENAIVVHPASRNSWKNIPAIHHLNWRQFGVPLITVGAPGEYLIPGSLDLRGRPFWEVAQAIVAARLVVAIHSTIACLSLYLNRPMVVSAPTPDPSYPSFGELSPKVLDLVQPTAEALQDAVWRVLKEIS